MSRRTRLIILISGVCAVLAAAILPWWWNRPAVVVPPLPSEQAVARESQEVQQAVESELACIDRLSRTGPPPGADPAAEFAKCREQAAPTTRGEGALKEAAPPPPEELRPAGPPPAP